MKKYIFLVSFILFFFVSLFPQTSYPTIESKNNLYFRDIAKILVEEFNLSKYDISPLEAENLLLSNYPKLNQISRNNFLCYNDISLLVMQLFNIQGGLFYSIFQNKHYSFRELQFLGIISEDIDPMKKISGKQAVELFKKASKL